MVGKVRKNFEIFQNTIFPNNLLAPLSYINVEFTEKSFILVITELSIAL